MDPYRDNLEHLHDELVRVDLMLRRGVVIARSAPDSNVPPDLRGLWFRTKLSMRRLAPPAL